MGWVIWRGAFFCGSCITSGQERAARHGVCAYACVCMHICVPAATPRKGPRCPGPRSSGLATGPLSLGSWTLMSADLGLLHPLLGHAAWERLKGGGNTSLPWCFSAKQTDGWEPGQGRQNLSCPHDRAGSCCGQIKALLCSARINLIPPCSGEKQDFGGICRPARARVRAHFSMRIWEK